MGKSQEVKADDIARFEESRDREIDRMRVNSELKELGRRFLVDTGPSRYTYHFDWLGRPIIAFPQDIVAFQEIVWRTRPDLIIEAGIAHGGSLVLSASLLTLLDVCDAAVTGSLYDPCTPNRRVVGIDIDIRQHNRELIEAHPLAARISMIQGSSIDESVVAQVKEIATRFKRVMVCLDSNHTHAHVLQELEAYAPLVSTGCYCIVMDTAIEDVPKDLFPDRPWGPGNNPKTAVHAFLAAHPEFAIDADIHNKLLITVAPDGYLKRLPTLTGTT